MVGDYAMAAFGATPSFVVAPGKGGNPSKGEIQN
jgi:hypothetical protein